MDHNGVLTNPLFHSPVHYRQQGNVLREEEQHQQRQEREARQQSNNTRKHCVAKYSSLHTQKREADSAWSLSDAATQVQSVSLVVKECLLTLSESLETTLDLEIHHDLETDPSTTIGDHFDKNKKRKRSTVKFKKECLIEKIHMHKDNNEILKTKLDLVSSTLDILHRQIQKEIASVNPIPCLTYAHKRKISERNRQLNNDPSTSMVNGNEKKSVALRSMENFVQSNEGLLQEIRSSRGSTNNNKKANQSQNVTTNLDESPETTELTYPQPGNGVLYTRQEVAMLLSQASSKDRTRLMDEWIKKKLMPCCKGYCYRLLRQYQDGIPIAPEWGKKGRPKGSTITALAANIARGRTVPNDHGMGRSISCELLDSYAQLQQQRQPNCGIRGFGSSAQNQDQREKNCPTMHRLAPEHNAPSTLTASPPQTNVEGMTGERIEVVHPTPEPRAMHQVTNDSAASQVALRPCLTIGSVAEEAAILTDATDVAAAATLVTTTTITQPSVNAANQSDIASGVENRTTGSVLKRAVAIVTNAAQDTQQPTERKGVLETTKPHHSPLTKPSAANKKRKTVSTSTNADGTAAASKQKKTKITNSRSRKKSSQGQTRPDPEYPPPKNGSMFTRMEIGSILSNASHRDRPALMKAWIRKKQIPCGNRACYRIMKQYQEGAIFNSDWGRTGRPPLVTNDELRSITARLNESKSQRGDQEGGGDHSGSHDGCRNSTGLTMSPVLKFSHEEMNEALVNYHLSKGRVVIPSKQSVRNYVALAALTCDARSMEDKQQQQIG